MSATMVDNSQLFANAAKEATRVALSAIGMKAEFYAKALCPVDTGRLRRSISHASDDNTA